MNETVSKDGKLIKNTDVNTFIIPESNYAPNDNDFDNFRPGVNV
jgi:hypothetical protein